MRFICCLLALYGLVDTAVAQGQRADSVYALPPIQIIGLRGHTSALEAPVRLSALDRSAVEATASTHLAALLDRAGAPFIRRYGNGLANLSFRGTSASQTLLLIDGLPFTDPQLGQIDLSLIPTAIVDGVQLIHGPAASHYGSQSIGGIVNIQTRPSQHPLFVEAQATAGPFGERTGQATMGINSGKLNGLLVFSHGAERGDFPFRNLSLFPPQTSRRSGADRAFTSAYSRFSMTSANRTTTFSAWHNDVGRGLPGPATTTPKAERQWDRNLRLQAQHRATLHTGTLRLAAATQRSTLRYLNPGLDIDQAGETSVAMLEAAFSEHTESKFGFEAGFSGSVYRAKHPSLSNRAAESIFSVFSHSRHVLGKLQLFPSIRADAFLSALEHKLVALSPGLGVNVQPFERSTIRLKANAGRAFRAPTFNDRFWQPGGNPDLKTERGWSYESGAVFEKHAGLLTATLEFTGFIHHIRDQITWLPAGQAIWSPQNTSRTRARGLELSGEAAAILSPATSLRAWTLYTFTDARDRSDVTQPSFNQPLRYVPRHAFKTGFSASHRIRKLTWLADLLVRHTGTRYVTTDGGQYLAPYLTLDVNLRATHRRQRVTVTAGAFLENATDRAYEVIKGYPMPPRVLRFVLTIRFVGGAGD